MLWLQASLSVTTVMRKRNNMRIKMALIGIFMVSILLMPPSFAEEVDLLVIGLSSSLFTDNTSATSAAWLAADKSAFSCNFQSKGSGKYCGVGIVLDRGGKSGLNMTEFNYLRLSIDYQGPARELGVGFRQAISAPASDPYGKPTQIVLPLRQGSNTFEVPLDEFRVLELWKEKNQALPVEQLSNERSNVLNIGIAVETPMEPGEHIFSLLEFKVSTMSVSQAKRTLVIKIMVMATIILLSVWGVIFYYWRYYSRDLEQEELLLQHKIISEKLGLDDEES